MQCSATLRGKDRKHPWSLVQWSALVSFEGVSEHTLRTGFGILQLTHRIHTQEYYDSFNTPFTGGKVKKQSKAAEEFGEKKQWRWFWPGWVWSDVLSMEWWGQRWVDSAMSSMIKEPCEVCIHTAYTAYTLHACVHAVCNKRCSVQSVQLQSEIYCRTLTAC